jgi:hypothetical protein
VFQQQGLTLQRASLRPHESYPMVNHRRQERQPASLKRRGSCLKVTLLLQERVQERVQPLRLAWHWPHESCRAENHHQRRQALQPPELRL